VQEYFEKHLFGGHPFARPIIGTAENVSRFSRDDCYAYTKKFYANENIIYVSANSSLHNAVINVFDITGKQLKSIKVNDLSGIYRLETDFASGTYLVKVVSDAKVSSSKVFITK